MTSFLFWNLNNKPLQKIISKIALEYDVDVLIFAEFSISLSDMLMALNKPGTSDYFYAPGIGCDKIHVFARFPDKYILPIYESSYLTIRHLNLPGLKDILLAATHFPSKLFWDEDSQMMECSNLANTILDVEAQIGHTRTILLGDFNMNPFETGLVSATGLHAVMSRQIARKGKRRVLEKEYPFFYNPMWTFFGDYSPGPSGTYYYSRSTHKLFFWNIFDQVLIRPNLIDSFHDNDLTIMTSTGTTDFLDNNGIPNKRKWSDHLPIFFRITI